MSSHSVDQIVERSAEDPQMPSIPVSYPPTEAKGKVRAEGSLPAEGKDIEHAPVRDDPRFWSLARKVSRPSALPNDCN